MAKLELGESPVNQVMPVCQVFKALQDLEVRKVMKVFPVLTI